MGERRLVGQAAIEALLDGACAGRCGRLQWSATLASQPANASLAPFRTAARNPDTLATRLLPTTAVWLDVIQHEADKLAREETDHPEVPSAFIAGLALTPDRAEDRTLFKGRTDIIKLIEHDLAPDRRGVLLVVGQRRMGKTSLCNYLPTYLGSGTLVLRSPVRRQGIRARGSRQREAQRRGLGSGANEYHRGSCLHSGWVIRRCTGHARE